MKKLIQKEYDKVLAELRKIVEMHDGGKIKVGHILKIAKRTKELLLKLDHLGLAVKREVERKAKRTKVVKHRKA